MVIVKSFWVLLGPLGGHFVVTLRSFLGTFGTILGVFLVSFRDHSGLSLVRIEIILGPFYVHFCANCGPSWGQFGVIWGFFGAIFSTFAALYGDVAPILRGLFGSHFGAFL